MKLDTKLSDVAKVTAVAEVRLDPELKLYCPYAKEKNVQSKLLQ